MNNETNSIISSLQNILGGNPWYGRAVYEVLGEVDEKKIYIKPNNNSHSIIDLLYHMLTWAEFTQKRIEKKVIDDMGAFNESDWRKIEPAIHTWQNGLAALKTSHQKIIELLQTKEDSFLEEKVDYRKYNFHYLLNGLIQHNIYHLGQIAYLSKLIA